MKISHFKKYFSVLLFFCFLGAFAQNSFPLPKNAVFYMEMNGKQLNNKIDWSKFNPFLQEITKDKKEIGNWNDYSKTGIKYDDTQYHYAVYNDSIKSYSAHFLLDNKERFLEFIHSTKKDGLEITKKNNYSYVSLDNNTFVAWNEKHAVLKTMDYSKPYKWNDAEEADVDYDSVSVVVDSAATTTTIPVYPNYENEEEKYGAVEVEKPFDYKEEIKYLEEDLEYYKNAKKENQKQVEKIQKDIQYLKKHHKYPEVKEEEKRKTTMDYYEESLKDNPPKEEEEGYYEENNYQKIADSIDVENFKIVSKLAEISFNEIFSSNFKIEVPAEKLKFRDAKSDVFVYTDFGQIYQQNDIYYKLRAFHFWQNYLGKMYNSHSAYNLYFDKKNVRVVNNYQHKNPVVQKSVSAVYDGKSNKNLAKLLSDKTIGFYAMNIDGYKSFDMMYDLIQNIGEDEEYQKEISLMVETMKIALDEKAISKILPGNAIFILDDLKPKKVEYTDYEYDEYYNETKVQKTKEVVMPDFTLAFATENEGYWKRVFEMISTSKESSKYFVKKGEFYSFKEKENPSSEIDELFFTVKNGIVFMTTSTKNIGEKNQSETTRKWAKDAAKHSLSGRLDGKKLMDGLEKEFADNKDRQAYNFFRKNVGEITYKTNAKGDSIESEVNYNINNSSENSLMYFIDLFDELYKIDHPKRKAETEF